MSWEDITNDLLSREKGYICDLIEFLMEKKKIDITDINLCHIRALESQISDKDKIIFDADNLLFNSVFTDSLGKPAETKDMLKKLKWLEERGTHNMEGIMDYLLNNCNAKGNDGRTERQSARAYQGSKAR